MNNAQVIKNFEIASRCMVKAALDEMKATDPEGYADVARAASSGAFFDVGCALSPAGLLEPRLELVRPTGERVTLVRVEYEPAH